MGYSSNKSIFDDWKHTYDSLMPHLSKQSSHDVVIKRSWIPFRLRHTNDDNENSVQVIMARTPIVTHHESGTCEIYNGGWYTIGTKRRIEEFMHPSWILWQNDFFWYVTSFDDKYMSPETYPYAHGMMLHVDGSVSHARASWPKHASVRGKRMPVFNIHEYMDRLYTTLAYWLLNHEDYELERCSNHPKVRQWGPAVIQVLDDVRTAMSDIAEARDGFEMFEAIMSANHIAHVSPFAAQNGLISLDYGSGRALPFRVVQAVSDDPGEYFGEEVVEEFFARSKKELPPVPITMSYQEYLEEYMNGGKYARR